MNDMFKKVNAREKLIGWYHSGPKLRASDLEINELFKRYTPHPLLVIVDVQPKEVGVPTDAYFAVEEIKDVSSATLTSFDLSVLTEGPPSLFGKRILFIHTTFSLSPTDSSRDLDLNTSLLTNNSGRHNNIQNLRPHTLRNRGRRS